MGCPSCGAPTEVGEKFCGGCGAEGRRADDDSSAGPCAARARSRNLGKLGREPFLLETSRPGVFAAGDIRSGATKMVAPAVGDGGMAVRFIAEHLARSPGSGQSVAVVADAAART